MRQKTELEITLQAAATGEARSGGMEGTEARTATTETESQAAGGPSMEAIVERDNLRRALAHVKRNKGAAGIDGMSLDALAPHLKEHWPAIRVHLLEGTYKPQPVRRVEIPKAAGGIAGTAGRMGPDVLRAQLRLPAEAIGAPGGGSGARVDRVRS